MMVGLAGAVALPVEAAPRSYLKRLREAYRLLDHGNCADAERILRALRADAPSARARALRSAELGQVAVCRRNPCGAVPLFEVYLKWAAEQPDGAVKESTHRAYVARRDQARATCRPAPPPAPLPPVSPARVRAGLEVSGGLALLDGEPYRSHVGLDLVGRIDLNGPDIVETSVGPMQAEPAGPRWALELGVGAVVEEPRAGRAHLGLSITDPEPADGGPYFVAAAAGWLGPATGVGLRLGAGWRFSVGDTLSVSLGADGTRWPGGAGLLHIYDLRLGAHHAL